MKQLFKVFYLRDAMTLKPTVKQFTSLVNGEPEKGVTKEHIDGLILVIKQEVDKEIKKLRELKSKIK